jgi:hypothetical protein
MTNKGRVDMYPSYQNSNHEQNIVTFMKKYSMAKGRNGNAN